MKTPPIKFCYLLANLLLLANGSARALDGAFVIANPSVPVENLSAAALKDIYTGKTKYWDGGVTIILVVLPDKTGDALQQACGMDASAFKVFWQRNAFSGRGQEPKKTATTAELLQLVASTKGAIAIAPADTALDGVKKVEIK